MSLRFSENDKYLGTLKKGVTNTFSITITNLTGNVMNIVQIKPCCSSCSSASLSKYTLAANESAELTVNFTPTSTAAIPVNKCIKLMWRLANVAAQNTSTFNFTAKVV